MKVLLFSDIHGDVRALERLLRQSADVYIAAGDLSTFGRDLDNCAAALGPLGERLWLLPGNHETHDQTRALCERYGFIDFHRQIRALGGTHWAGLGYSNPTPFNTPGEYTEEEIAEALAAFEDLRPLNLVVHFPPHGTTLDQAGPFSRGEHAGSRVLREWVTRVQPAHLFCGHIHECAGRTDRIGQTECLNVGKEGYLLEIL
jgi:Icc-related predicted phosphoesterase